MRADARHAPPPMPGTDAAGFDRPPLDFRPAPPPMSRENTARLQAWVKLRAAAAARRARSSDNSMDQPT